MTGAVERCDLFVVLGATGGIGRAVVAAAVARGHRVRAVSRSARSAVDLPAGTERFDADGSTPAAAAAAVAGVSAVLPSAQSHYTRWPREFPALTATVADATAAVEAKLVSADNLYM